MALYNQVVLITYTAQTNADFTSLETKVNNAVANSRIKEIIRNEPQNKLIEVRIDQEVEIS